MRTNRFALIFTALIAVVFAYAFWPLLALAQPVGTWTPPETGSSTFTLDIWHVIASALTAAALALSAFVGKLINAKVKNAVAQSVLTSFFQKVQALVAHVWTEAQAEIDKDLADGKLTPDEIKALRDRVLLVAKNDLAADLAALPSTLGLSAGSVNNFLSGMIARAIQGFGLGMLPGNTGAPTAAKPASTVPISP